MDKLNVSLIQADLVWENHKENLSNFDKLLTRLPDDTDVIVLPEMFTTGFSMNSKKMAETMEGVTMLWMQSNAKRYDAAITGSVVIHENGKYFNRLLWVNPDGSYEKYDKKYLFSLATEDDHYGAGKDRLIFEYKDWKICPLICYDLRFPEWARNTIDYDLLIYVANWPKTRADHWSTLLKARAIENQCFVIGVNRVGEDGNGLIYSGNTSLYNYNGDKLEEEIGSECVVSAEISKMPMLKYRENLPFLKDQV